MLLSHFGHSGFPFHLLDVNIGTVIHLYMLWNRMREEKPKNTYTLLFFFFASFGCSVPILSIKFTYTEQWTRFSLNKNAQFTQRWFVANILLLAKLVFNRETKKNKNKTKEIVCVLYYDEGKTSLAFFFVGPMCQRIQYTQCTNTIHNCDIKVK